MKQQNKSFGTEVTRGSMWSSVIKKKCGVWHCTANFFLKDIICKKMSTKRPELCNILCCDLHDLCWVASLVRNMWFSTAAMLLLTQTCVSRPIRLGWGGGLTQCSMRTLMCFLSSKAGKAVPVVIESTIMSLKVSRICSFHLLPL